MGRLTRLDVLHNNKGTSDKVYGIGVLHNEQRPYWQLVTFYGPRGGSKALVVAKEAEGGEADAIWAANKTRDEKIYRKGYIRVNWSDAAFKKVQDVIRDIDPDFGSSAAGIPVKAGPPTKPAQAAVTPPTPPRPQTPAPTTPRTIQKPPPLRPERAPREIDL